MVFSVIPHVIAVSAGYTNTQIGDSGINLEAADMRLVKHSFGDGPQVVSQTAAFHEPIASETIILVMAVSAIFLV